MHTPGFLIALLSLVHFVVGDFTISKPDEDTTVKFSDSTAKLEITWKSDDDDGLALSDATTFVLSLCTGPDSSIVCPVTLSDSVDATDKKYTATLDEDEVPSGWWYVQFYIEFEDADASIITYSDRFKISGSDATTGTLKVTATGDPPSGLTNSGTATAIDSASFSVTYTKQTGKTKYAPMQTQPGTTITHTTWSRRFPTSAYTPYSTLSKSPNAVTTNTPGWDYTVKSATNTAKTAAYPSSFYAASSRVSKATLSTAAKRRRWLD